MLRVVFNQTLMKTVNKRQSAQSLPFYKDKARKPQ